MRLPLPTSCSENKAPAHGPHAPGHRRRAQAGLGDNAGQSAAGLHFPCSRTHVRVWLYASSGQVTLMFARQLFCHRKRGFRISAHSPFLLSSSHTGKALESPICSVPSPGGGSVTIQAASTRASLWATETRACQEPVRSGREGRVGAGHQQRPQTPWAALPHHRQRQRDLEHLRAPSGRPRPGPRSSRSSVAFAPVDAVPPDLP